MKKITFLMSFLLLLSWQGMAQTTLYLTTSGGSFSTEKWVDITDGVDGTGAVLWAQGNGTYGDSPGLVTDVAFTVVDGSTYYINCYDKFADGWDGTTYEIRTAPAGGGILVANNGGLSPDDGTDNDGTSAWDIMDDERESSEAFSYTPPACLQTGNLTASNITATSVDLGWTENGTATTWDIEYGVAPYTFTGTPTISGTNSNPHNLVGLTSGTSYVFYVRADCGVDGASLWTGPFAFTTAPDYCAGDHFYDNGGATGDYSNSVTNETTVICPSTPGDVVTVTFNSFDTEAGWDDLTIYNGNGTGGASFGTFDGTTIPGPFTSTDASGCLTFVFNSDGSGTRAGWDATITCTPPPTCPQPSALTATNLTSTTADLAWTENGTATSWDIEYGIAPYTFTGTPTIAGTSSNPHNLIGLTATTSYEYYVRADCGLDGASTWAGPYTFTTPIMGGTCGLYTIDLEDDFGDGWNGGVIDIYINGALFAGGVTLNNGSGPETTYIPVNIGDIISIDYTAGSFSDENIFTLYDESMSVVASEGGVTTPNDIGDYTVPTGITACATCPDPSALTATNITSTSADLAWTENGTATTWDIEYGVAPYTFTGTPTITGTATNPHNLAGLTATTSYEFYVRAHCGVGDSSAWVGPYSFTTTCAPIISTFPWTENFDGETTPNMPCGWMVDNVNADAYTWVTASTFANSSPNSMQVRWNSAEAANDWSFTPELVLVGGQEYELSFAFAAAGSTMPEKLKVMYGATQDVTGMTTVLFDSTFNNVTFNTAYVTFTPATSGSYFIGFHNYSDANMFRVYVDDVSLKEVTACSSPSNLTAFNITQTSAMLDWTENGTATEWNIEWGIQGFTLGTGTPEYVTAKPFLLDNLTPSTPYTYYVQADCGSDSSAWVAFDFMTSPCAPIGLELGTDTTLCSDQSLTLNAPVGGTYGYTWSTTESTSSIVVDTTSLGGNGTYNITVDVVDFATTCTYSDNINVTFSVCTGIDKNATTNNINIYPNPTTGIFTITGNVKNATVNVMSITGEVIYQNNIIDNSSTIDLSNNAKGLYFISISSENGTETYKVIVQ
jgi:uncharacterized protein (DUF433 family)